MNLSEINWDINAAGTWPWPIKVAAALLVSAAVTGAAYYYDTVPQLEELDKITQQETDLKNSFKLKQKKAANLQSYEDQLRQIEASLGEMLRQLPSKSEVANLLVDISQTGLASGLEFRLFKPLPDINQDFYMELPISIQVVGKYDELGLFISGIASLPRIVTVHDVSVSPGSDGKMLMNATVKTYYEAESSSQSDAEKRRTRR
jgi:type IV pilus assembly protein PilO